MSDLETIIGYAFQNKTLLQQALTHPSTKKRGHVSPYERMEFLGDRVLGLVMAEWLLALYPTEAEGQIAKRYAALVKAQTLAHIASDIQLDKFLIVNSDDKTNIITPSMMADGVEALIAAIYLDGGLNAAHDFIRRVFGDSVQQALDVPSDPKTALQEWAQSRGLALPAYTIINQTGPAHAPEFTIQVTVNGIGSATASGTSRRDAEKSAASELLKAKIRD